jgi:hypothetical protein
MYNGQHKHRFKTKDILRLLDLRDPSNIPAKVIQNLVHTIDNLQDIATQSDAVGEAMSSFAKIRWRALP